MNNLMNNLLNVAKNSAWDHFNNATNTNDKLSEQLYMCTYTDEIKYKIQKAVRQLLHVYPNFTSDIISFTENGKPMKFIQLKGILEIDVKGKNCKVDYNLMLPQHFPRKPPFARIINRGDFMVDDFYKNLCSPNDKKSFVLNPKLHQVNNWNESNSIVKVVIESYELLRNRFPFSKGNNHSNHSEWGSSTNKAWDNSKQPANQWGNPVNQGWNQNQTHTQNIGWGNQATQNVGGTNQNQGWGNQNQGFGNSNQNQGWGGGMTNKQPPIPFNNSNPQNQMKQIAEGQKYVGASREILKKLKFEQQKSLDSVQGQIILKQSLKSQQQYLKKESQSLQQFLIASENDPVDNVAKSIVPRDQLSSQIIDLLASIRARQEVTIMLEGKYNDDEISLEEFLKHLRKVQESRFQQNALLQKCLKSRN